MKPIAIIPARYGSSRFPGKPLVDIAGRPMIQWVYEQATKVLSNVYVATDDQRIMDAVAAFGGQAVMTSDQHQSGTDRLAEAVRTIQSQTGNVFDIVVNIQGDEPFIQPEQIEAIIGCFSSPNVDIATLIKPIDDESVLSNPNSPKVVIGTRGQALYFSRSPIPYARGMQAGQWTANHQYYKHIGIYGYRTEVLYEITELEQSPLELAESLEQLRWLENGYIVQTALTDFEGMAVDTPEDLQHVLESLGF